MAGVVDCQQLIKMYGDTDDPETKKIILENIAARCGGLEGYALREAARHGWTRDVALYVASKILKYESCIAPRIHPLVDAACVIADRGGVKEAFTDMDARTLKAFYILKMAGLIDVDDSALAEAAAYAAYAHNNPSIVDTAVELGLLPPIASKIAHGEAPFETAEEMSEKLPGGASLLALWLRARSATILEINGAKKPVSVKTTETLNKISEAVNEGNYVKACGLIKANPDAARLLDEASPGYTGRICAYATLEKAGLKWLLNKLDLCSGGGEESSTESSAEAECTVELSQDELRSLVEAMSSNPSVEEAVRTLGMDPDKLRQQYTNAQLIARYNELLSKHDYIGLAELAKDERIYALVDEDTKRFLRALRTLHEMGLDWLLEKMKRAAGKAGGGVNIDLTVEDIKRLGTYLGDSRVARALAALGFDVDALREEHRRILVLETYQTLLADNQYDAAARIVASNPWIISYYRSLAENAKSQKDAEAYNKAADLAEALRWLYENESWLLGRMKCRKEGDKTACSLELSDEELDELVKKMKENPSLSEELTKLGFNPAAIIGEKERRDIIKRYNELASRHDYRGVAELLARHPWLVDAVADGDEAKRRNLEALLLLHERGYDWLLDRLAEAARRCSGRQQGGSQNGEEGCGVELSEEETRELVEAAASDAGLARALSAVGLAPERLRENLHRMEVLGKYNECAASGDLECLAELAVSEPWLVDYFRSLAEREEDKGKAERYREAADRLEALAGLYRRDALGALENLGKISRDVTSKTNTIISIANDIVNRLSHGFGGRLAAALSLIQAGIARRYARDLERDAEQLEKLLRAGDALGKLEVDAAAVRDLAATAYAAAAAGYAIAGDTAKAEELIGKAEAINPHLDVTREARRLVETWKRLPEVLSTVDAMTVEDALCVAEAVPAATAPPAATRGGGRYAV